MHGYLYKIRYVIRISQPNVFFFFFCDTRDQIGYVDMYGY